MCLTATESLAQEDQDSLRTYNLSEIVIGGETRGAERIQRLHRVGLSALAIQDSPDVASTLRLLPSASVQTNSRGETLVYIRAAGERQVALFLDGAPLNIPWDNRIDLSLVPANIIGGVSVERGAVSAGYGTNVSGGAVNLQTRNFEAQGTLSELNGQAGSGDSWQTRALFASRSEKSTILIGSTLASTGGMVLPSEAELPYENSSTRRLNTDRSEGNVYLRLDREMTNASWGFTFLHASANKGVAPEGHLNPLIDNVRYWRYPLWRNTMAILNGSSHRGRNNILSTVWLSRFQQEIDQYGDEHYQSVLETQEDLDISGGVRLIGERTAGPVVLRGITFVTTSKHEQSDIDRLMAPGEASAPQAFRNVLYSIGLELTSASSDEGHWAAGATLDGMSTPLTGDKPSSDPFRAASLNAEYVRVISEGLAVKMNAGSKPRFPTMRELFGTALNRFIPNPELKPERTWMAETGVEYFSENISFETVAFLQRTIDTIDQINVFDGEVRKRKRVNLDGSRVYGLEFVSRVAPWDRLTIDGHLTWMRPIALTDDGNRHLMEKPEVLATISAQLTGLKGLVVNSTLVYTGTAYGLAVDNKQVQLPASTLVNFRLSSRKYFSRSGLFSEMFAGVDNVFDDLHLPQLGLPSAGRSFRFGVNLSR